MGLSVICQILKRFSNGVSSDVKSVSILYYIREDLKNDPFKLNT